MDLKISWLKTKKDQDSFKLIKRLGFDVHELEDPERIDNEINKLINEKCYNIILTNEIASFSEDIIKKYLDTIDKEVWIEKANKIINKSLKSNNKYSSKYLKDKLLYDLSSKGYDNNDILELINNIDKIININGNT